MDKRNELRGYTKGMIINLMIMILLIDIVFDVGGLFL